METRNQTPGADVGTRQGTAPHNDPDRTGNELKQQGKVVRDQARAAGEQIRSAASEAGKQAKDKAGEIAEQTQRKAAEYARQAKSQGAAALEQQKHRCAEQVQTLGEAVHRAAEKFREEKDDNIAGYIDAAADEVRRLGDYLERRDLNSLWRDAQSFGRRRPEWFLGGMFVAGMALTRFLKASGEREASEEVDRFGSPGYRGDPASPMFTGTAGFGSHDRGSLPVPSGATRPSTGTAGTGTAGSGIGGTVGAAGAGATYPPAMPPTSASTTSTPTTTPGLSTPSPATQRPTQRLQAEPDRTGGA